MNAGSIAEPPPPETEREEQARLQEEKVQDVKDRAVTGAKSLGLRTVYSFGLRILSSLVLSHMLTKGDYGVFGLAAQISSLGMYFGDAGIAGALVQKKEEPSENEYFTAFLCQQVLMLVFILALTFGTRLVRTLYHLGDTPDDNKAIAIMVAMAWALLLISLRVVPLIRLERHLNFREIARVELIENSIRTLTTIGLAVLHFGPWALASGNILGMVAFLVLIWTFSRWVPRGKFDFKLMLPMLRYGLPFQLNALVPALIMMPVSAIITRSLGLGSLGLFNWALNLAQLPIMMNAVLIRVAFPAYSRLQDDPIALGRYLGASSRRIAAVLFTLVSLFVIACPVAVPLIFGKQWTEAVGLAQWLFLDAVLYVLVGNLAAVQNATGRPMERTWVSVGIGALRCIATYFAVRWNGLAGVVIFGVAIPSFLELMITAYLTRRHNPEGTRALYSELLTPILGNGVILGAAMIIGSAVTPLTVGTAAWASWAQMGITLAAYILLTAAREFVTPFQFLRQEVPGILALLRPNRI